MFDVAVETCKNGSSILTKCRSKEHNSSKICHLLQNRVSAVGDTMELTDGLWTPELKQMKALFKLEHSLPLADQINT